MVTGNCIGLPMVSQKAQQIVVGERRIVGISAQMHQAVGKVFVQHRLHELPAILEKMVVQDYVSHLSSDGMFHKAQSNDCAARL